METYEELAKRNHFNVSNTEFINGFYKFAESSANKSKLIQDFLRVKNAGQKLPASRFSISYWTLRGYSLEEANIIRGKAQGKNTSYEGLLERLIKQGKTDEEVDYAKKEFGKKRGVQSSKTHAENEKKDPLYKKKMSRFFKEFWLKKGYTEEESIKLAYDASLQNRKKFREKIDAGEIEKGWNTTTIEYYLKKGYSIDESERKLKERQSTFTLNKCIAKYGEEIGRQKFHDRQEKWIAKWKSLYKSGAFSTSPLSLSSTRYSKISLDLFFILSETYRTSYMGINEFWIRNDEKKLLFYDFCVKEKKKIIEFNGDYWHCNPRLYSPDFFNRNKQMTAQQIWDFDNKKEELARAKGYDYLVIWESEYKLNPDVTINKCKNFLEN